MKSNEFRLTYFGAAALLILDEQGKSIDEIQGRLGQQHLIDDQNEIQTKPVWHSKPKTDEKVAKMLNLPLGSFERKQGSRNNYSNVADQISNFRKYGWIKDWDDEKKSIWRLVKKLSFSDKSKYKNMVKNKSNSIVRIVSSDLLPTLDLNKCRSNLKLELAKHKRSDLKFELNETTKITDVIFQVRQENWVIPNFQRNFDWKSENVREFLSSIFMNEYVGSLLLWRASDTEKLDCIPVHGVSSTPKPYSMIILDGQQRITSLYHTMHLIESIDKDKKFPGYFYVNLKVFLEGGDPDELIIREDEKLEMDGVFEQFLFPIYYCDGRINEWIYEFEQYSKGGKLIESDIHTITTLISLKLTNIMEHFRIPYVVFPSSMKFNSVATIFEHLNSTGMHLGTFDLLNVRLSINSVKLKDLWDQTCDKYEQIERYFEDKPRITKLNLYIIEAMSLAFTEQGSCKQKDILDMYKKNDYTVESFEEQWNMMSKFTADAIDYLEDQDGGGVSSNKDLPYQPIVPVISALLQKISLYDDKKTSACMDKLSWWYWTSVFDARYSSAVQSTKTSDYKDLLDWFDDESCIPQYISDFRNNYTSKLNLENVRGKDSVYLGIFSLLTKNHAKDMGRKIKTGAELHMDHIFPKSEYKKRGLENSIINMTWLVKRSNFEKAAKKPRDYFKIISKRYGTPKEFHDALESNFITKNCYDNITNDNFEGFIAERKKLLLSKIGTSIGANV